MRMVVYNIPAIPYELLSNGPEEDYCSLVHEAMAEQIQLGRDVPVLTDYAIVDNALFDLGSLVVRARDERLALDDEFACLLLDEAPDEPPAE